ncbi:hypothetical protein SynROS8604_02403 [Synechococcus sp. ROS8604]|nr:hypothetical protein SynROS8604_02403 [Synechococcus sp. ROS8604]
MEGDDLAVIGGSRSIDQTASGASSNGKLKGDRHDPKLAQGTSKTNEASGFQLIQKRGSTTNSLIFLNKSDSLHAFCTFSLGLWKRLRLPVGPSLSNDALEL